LTTNASLAVSLMLKRAPAVTAHVMPVARLILTTHLRYHSSAVGHSVYCWLQQQKVSWIPLQDTPYVSQLHYTGVW